MTPDTIDTLITHSGSFHADSAQVVIRAITGRSHPNWLELPRAMDYLEPILAAGSDADADEIQFVIAPSRAEWQLNTVNVSLDSFQARRLLPAAWAGLRGPELATATGVEDAIFCHVGRFIAIAGSRESAMALLRQALSTSPANAR